MRCPRGVRIHNRSRLTMALPLCLLGSLHVLAPPADAAHEYNRDLRLRSRSGAPEASITVAEAYLASQSGPRAHLLVQPRDLGNRAQRDLLTARGARFLQYLPDNTWFVSVPIDFFARTGVATEIYWAEPLTREDRLHPRLWDGEPGACARSDREDRWWFHLTLFSDVDHDVGRRVVERSGAVVVASYPAFGSFRIEAGLPSLEALAREDVVKWIREVAPPPIATNDGSRAATGAEIVQAPPYNLSGAGITVGVWDAGEIDDDHLDLIGRVILGETSATHGHATHVAGTIGGDGTASEIEGEYDLQYRGMAPGISSLISYDFNGYADMLVEHGDIITTYGASVSSNSWHWAVNEDLYGNCSMYGDYDFLAPEYDQIIAGLYGAPINIMFAAGNERDDMDCGMTGDPLDSYGILAPPGTAKNILTVGAFPTTVFSSWGPTDDGRIKPELSAPGSDVTSTWPFEFQGTYYHSLSGTSMSTPAVSGCVALFQEAFVAMEGSLPEPAVTRALLVHTATDVGAIGPGYENGFGAINIRAAVDQLERGWTEAAVDHGVTLEFPMEVNGTYPLKVTLAWTDPAGAPLAMPALVNDLDLSVLDPLQNEHLPWTLNPASPHDPATPGVNSLDVIEQVVISDPAPGTWMVRVTGTNVPMGPQSFALTGLIDGPTCGGGNVIHVPGDYSGLGEALAVAASCDTILVAPGTYTVSESVDEAVVIRSVAGAAATTLEAPVLQRILHVTADAVIDGFTFLHGYASGSGTYDRYGGAIMIEECAPTIRNCVFFENGSSGGGSGMFATGSSPRVTGCEFRSNVTPGLGGALWFDNCYAFDLRDCLFYQNSAGGTGGAIVISGSAGAIRGNTIVENESSIRGGGMIVGSNGQSGVVEIRRNIVVGNTAPEGGGIACGSNYVTGSCNDVWNNGDDYYTCGPFPDDISADPLFCDVAGGDFRIDLESPCAPEASPAGCGRIGAFDPINCVVGVSDGDAAPRVVTFGALRPNPARAGVTMIIGLPEPSPVVMMVFDTTGRVMRRVVEPELVAGSHEVVWDGRDRRGIPVGAGVYFTRVEAGGRTITRKIVMVR